MDLTHEFIINYMKAKTDNARFMYSIYLSYMNPYLFESEHKEEYDKYINNINKETKDKHDVNT